MTFSTGILPPMTSTFTFGRSVASTSAPRYFSPEPFWIPQPITCITVIPLTPRWLSSFCSSANFVKLVMISILDKPVAIMCPPLFNIHHVFHIFFRSKSRKILEFLYHMRLIVISTLLRHIIECLILVKCHLL